MIRFRAAGGLASIGAAGLGKRGKRHERQKNSAAPTRKVWVCGGVFRVGRIGCGNCPHFGRYARQNRSIFAILRTSKGVVKGVSMPRVLKHASKVVFFSRTDDNFFDLMLRKNKAGAGFVWSLSIEIFRGMP